MDIPSLRMVGAIKDKLLAGPEDIYLDINYACNLNCNYCRLHSLLRKKTSPELKQTITLKDIQEISLQAKKWQCKCIILTGHGEPTLNPNFQNIIKSIQRYGTPITLYTNGAFPFSLLTCISTIDHVVVNFSAPTEKLFARTIAPKHPELYKHTLKNLRTLGLLGQRKNKPFTEISFIITSKNYLFIPKTIKLAEECGFKKITFSGMMPTSSSIPLLLAPHHSKKISVIADKITKEKHALSHNLAEWQRIPTMRKPSCGKAGLQCFTGWFNLVIRADKKICLCCRHNNPTIGDLSKQSLDQIWNSAKTQEARLKYKYGFNLTKAPFKNTCEWCRWIVSFNQTISTYQKKIKPA